MKNSADFLKEQDEQIISKEKASVFNYAFHNCTMLINFIILAIALTTIAQFAPINSQIIVNINWQLVKTIELIVGLIIIFLLVVALVIVVSFSIKNAKNYYVILTNKRLVIQSNKKQNQFEFYCLSDIIKIYINKITISNKIKKVYVLNITYQNQKQERILTQTLPIKNAENFLGLVMQQKEKNT